MYVLLWEKKRHIVSKVAGILASQKKDYGINTWSSIDDIIFCVDCGLFISVSLESKIIISDTWQGFLLDCVIISNKKF